MNDANANLVAFTDRRGLHSEFVYDDFDRLTGEHYVGAKVSRTYDAAGRLVEVRDSASGQFSYDYDTVGRWKL